MSRRIGNPCTASDPVSGKSVCMQAVNSESVSRQYRRKYLRTACFREENPQNFSAECGYREDALQVIDEELTVSMKNASAANVFVDLGVADAENLKLRAQLMLEIDRYIRHQRLTQAEAAQRLGTTQPRINDIIRGRIDKCSIDRLVNMLALAGVRVNLKIMRKAA